MSRALELALIYCTIHTVGMETGVDPAILAALAKVESNLRPQAIGDNLQSHGMYQFHLQGGGASSRPDDLHKIDYSTRLAAGYVMSLMAATDWSLEDMASAYNQGLSGWRSRGRSFNQAYVDRFIAEYNWYKEHPPERLCVDNLYLAIGGD